MVIAVTNDQSSFGFQSGRYLHGTDLNPFRLNILAGFLWVAQFGNVSRGEIWGRTSGPIWGVQIVLPRDIRTGRSARIGVWNLRWGPRPGSVQRVHWWAQVVFLAGWGVHGGYRRAVQQLSLRRTA